MTAVPKRVRKADVVRSIRRERERIVGIATRLGPDAIAAPLVADWSVRDVLAHSVYWQAMLARMMGSALPPPGWLPRGKTEHDLGGDELNRLAVAHYRPIATDTLLRDFTFTAELVLAIVAEMKEANLGLEAGSPWSPGTTVAQAIEGESHGHWREHSDEIEAALAR